MRLRAVQVFVRKFVDGVRLTALISTGVTGKIDVRERDHPRIGPRIHEYESCIRVHLRLRAVQVFVRKFVDGVRLTALISAVVTGKIDVRKETIHEYPSGTM